MTTVPSNKVELRLLKPFLNGEIHEFTLSLNPDIRLEELTDYLRKEWKVLSEKPVFYKPSLNDQTCLNEKMTLG